ncbi:two-component system response regulator TrcR [Parabacteroides sp. PFB2-10]|uniref:response regulator transcription factor n=1 Tax=Parabacteroides sp. PFB2-10 TaxID=1742405 RepID=UPI0024750E10|nr:response regulator transcription factor [Parabacteroides sp. PFB2-10]MDH6312117.1 two-component system response regulator TrcR [Parabacteroides sp. PFB2-10]MDL2244609.1 response regulator transcription factor [Parabacteroides sp. OttesenSCG-928-J18]
MEKINVLLVEDEATLAMIIKDTLDGPEFDIQIAEDGREGLRLFREKTPDIIVTDVMMPAMDGFSMVKEIRQSDPSIPILFLSARSAASDVVEGFEIGGNDYLKKPFGMAELIIRIKALLHKVEYRKPEIHLFEIGAYTFDSLTQTLSFQGEKEALSNRESEILKRLCENRDQVMPMKEILLDLWGDDSFFNTRSLHVFITKLRRKLSRDPSIRILNVRGIGYKMIVVHG